MRPACQSPTNRGATGAVQQCGTILLLHAQLHRKHGTRRSRVHPDLGRNRGRIASALAGEPMMLATLSGLGAVQACVPANLPSGYDPVDDPSNPCNVLQQITQNFSGAPDAQGLMVVSPTPQQLAQYNAALPACQAWHQAHPCLSSTPSGNVITSPMPTVSYTACSSVSPWNACAGGAVIGPNGQVGVCGPCGGGIGIGEMFTNPTMLALIGGGLLLLLFLVNR